jgi:hypothetical protein
MSFSYDRYDRRQSSNSRRTTFGYWVPLILTVTVATAGLAAWVWSERRDDDENSDDDNLSYGEERPHRDGMMSHGVVHEDEGLMSRVHGVLRRTPSPQQFLDTISKRTVAGVAAAAGAAGAALASIREEDKDDKDDKDDFGDHSRWSEEAALRRQVEARSSQSASAVDTHAKSFVSSLQTAGLQFTGRRKTVAIVVSAESLMDNPHEDDANYRSENAVRAYPTRPLPKLTWPDHSLPPPRHGFQQNKTLRPRILSLSPLTAQLTHRRWLPWILIRCHHHSSTHSSRRAQDS